MEKKIFWKVKVLLDNGEETWWPVYAMKKDDPLVMAQYAFDEKVTNTNCWKCAKKFKK